MSKVKRIAQYLQVGLTSRKKQVKSRNKNEVENTGYKTINGIKVLPVRFMGKDAGFGNFMAGCLITKNSDLIRDNTGKPIPFHQINMD